MYPFKNIALFAPCTSVILAKRIYYDPYQGAIHLAVMNVAAYNLAWLDLSVNELIVPIVDCSQGSVVYDNEASVRLYDLTQMVEYHDDMYLCVVTMLIQKYITPVQNEHGEAGVATVTFINGLREKDVRDPQPCARPPVPVPKPTHEVYTVDSMSSNSLWCL